MKVTDVRVHALEPFAEKFHFTSDWDPITVERVFVRILTDDGHEGHCITVAAESRRDAGEAAGAREGADRPRPPRRRGDLLRAHRRLRVPTPAASAIDIALWDVLGKHHGEPIYRVLGAARDRIPPTRPRSCTPRTRTGSTSRCSAASRASPPRRDRLASRLGLDRRRARLDPRA
jgi:L-alanine-DL-glutamate epimerase-like enolase superfamily enzyme